MKIDAHQHYWNFDPVRDAWMDDSMEVIRRDFLPEDLLPLLKDSGVNGCIAVQADQSETETSFLLACAEKYSFIKGVVGWVDLLDVNVEDRLAHFSKNPFFKGVRHILQAESEDFVLRKDFQNGIQKLCEFDLTYDILVYPNQLKNICELVEKFPKQKFVLDHLGKPYIKASQIESWSVDVHSLAIHGNVYCKISGFVTEADWNHWKTEDFTPYFDVAFDTFGSDRIIFGSDWPVCNVASGYNEVIGIVEHYTSKLSDNQQDDVMGNNAVRFYNL